MVVHVDARIRDVGDDWITPDIEAEVRALMSDNPRKSRAWAIRELRWRLLTRSRM